MPDHFVPLHQALSSATGVPVARPVSAAPAAPSASAAFEPLVRTGSSTTHSANCSTQPKVTLQRNGDVVTSIRVECTCGQVIELNCQY